MEGLGSGILNIISSTPGVLPYSQLRNFLNQVRNKKKIVEIAGYFTSDIPALVRQLHRVEAAYYKHGRKGCRIEKDIDFVQKVRMRLQKGISTSNEERDCVIVEHSNVFRTSMSGQGRTEVFASTSSCMQTSTVTAQNQSGREKPTLSSGICKIIFRTGGELSPTVMCNFLNEVRGRKKAMEIAHQFTSNVPALANQLRDIEANYYNQGIRSDMMNKDIGFIKRLYTRLQSESNTGCASGSKNYISEEWLNRHSIFSSNGRKEEIFTSTSSCKQISVAAAEKQSRVQRPTTLGSGTRKIISVTWGRLPAAQLCKFLKHVRGKRNATEIARRYANDIPDLINQLKDVETNYYNMGRKGSRMDQDIKFIRRQYMRLQSERNKEYRDEGFSRGIISMQKMTEEYSEEEEDSEGEYSEDEYSEEEYSEDEYSE